MIEQRTQHDIRSIKNLSYTVKANGIVCSGDAVVTEYDDDREEEGTRTDYPEREMFF